MFIIPNLKNYRILFMKTNALIQCSDFPCQDVNNSGFQVPNIEFDPVGIKMIMISEASPEKTVDYFYASENALFRQTTLLAFKDAGFEFNSISDLLNAGIYLTTAVKCAKTGYLIKTNSIKNCSLLLEQELALFPNIKVLMLMGDVAIKSLNYIAKRQGEPRVIPAGSTYKIRGGEFYYKNIRAFPSYLQAGPSFFIEKSKRRMIAEDIKLALEKFS